jgi:outer membrane receptor for ferrienterochelin and colicins
MEFLNVGPAIGYTVRGNPDLRPEVSRNLTASVEWAAARSYLRVQAFENRFDDFIETRAVGDSSGVTIYTYGNVDDGFTRGGEIEAGVTRVGGGSREATVCARRAVRDR